MPVSQGIRSPAPRDNLWSSAVLRKPVEENMFQLKYEMSTWPVGTQRHTSTLFPSMFGVRPILRNLRRFAQLEDNFVLSVQLIERDIAHERDMETLRKEQLRADVWDDDALFDSFDDYEF